MKRGAQPRLLGDSEDQAPEIAKVADMVNAHSLNLQELEETGHKRETGANELSANLVGTRHRSTKHFLVAGAVGSPALRL